MRRIRWAVAAVALGAVSTAAVAQGSQQTFDCSTMKVAKRSKLPDIIRLGCGLVKKCRENIAREVIIGTEVMDGLITRANVERAARDNQECLARAAEASLEMGEPLTVSLEGGATGTVTGSALAGPRREFELPLVNPMLQFAEADLVTLADWYRTTGKNVAIMDAPVGGQQVGTIAKRKTKVYALGHYGNGRALVEVDGAIAGYVEMSALETVETSTRPQFADASSTRPVFARMTCIGSDFRFDNAEEGAETVGIAECYGPLGEADFIPFEELGNA